MVNPVILQLFSLFCILLIGPIIIFSLFVSKETTM